MNAVSEQLHKIAGLQSLNDPYFTNGLFASKRVWAKGMYLRSDDTAFFSACIGFTLRRYKNLFSDEEVKFADHILEKMYPAFELFRNKDGHASYNFWKTLPSKHFPGGYLAHKLQFFMIPDDIDDSAMIHLVREHSKEEQLALKEKMIKYAIGNLKWPDKPVTGYEKFKPYNTFFVKHMPSAFDICALCNTLYFVHFYNLPLNEQDEHSLQLILKCLEQDDHITRPYAMSPYYPNSVLIIYHVVRLMTDLRLAALLKFKPKLLLQVRKLLTTKNIKETEKLMLVICIQKLDPGRFLIEEPDKKEKATYNFFVAGLLGEAGPKWLRNFAHSDATHIKYRSIAYAETLWLEHLLLNRA